MKYIFLICMLLTACSVDAQTVDNQTQTNLVEKIVHAIKSKDSGTIELLLHDDFSLALLGQHTMMNTTKPLTYSTGN